VKFPLKRAALLACLVLATAHAEETNKIAPAPDSSQALTRAAWDCLGAGNFAAAESNVARCRELYETKAREMQSSLTELAPPEKANDYWALNDVGTCVFIAGRAAEGQGKKKEAAAEYQAVIDLFPLAQCWDAQGWFWRPAVAAKERLTALSFDDLK
jgi:hypothetical protein